MNDQQRNTPPLRSAHPWWTILAGLAFAVAALIAVPLTGVGINDVVDNVRGQVTWTTLFVGVFITGCLFWFLLLTWPRRFSMSRGAIAGVLVAFFSYPVVLALAEIFQRDQLNIQQYESRGGNVLVRIVLTQVTTGFAATLTLAVVGCAVALLLRLRHPDTAPERGRGFWRSVPKFAAGLALFIVVALVAAFAVLTLMPLDTGKLIAQQATASTPLENYDEAVAAIDAVRAEEDKLPLNPRCHSTLLTHGKKVARVVVFFHGLTNCPAQAEQLGAKLFALGYNVYLPRIPQHGYADQMSLALADLTAEDMVAVGNQATDIAQGLGDEVVITGLSAGGIISAWTSQFRADADQSISLAPFLAPNVVPGWANHAATNLLLNLPNVMVWWDAQLRDNPPGMTYAYPRYATRGLAQALRMSAALMEAADTRPPLSPGIGMMLNEADDAISNREAEDLVVAWKRHGAGVDLEVLPLELGLGHDVIDPHQPTGNPDLVYGLLIDMMNGTKTQYSQP